MFFNTKQELEQIAKETMSIELNKSTEDIYWCWKFMTKCMVMLKLI
jgi:hypothetical protein